MGGSEAGARVKAGVRVRVRPLGIGSMDPAVNYPGCGESLTALSLQLHDRPVGRLSPRTNAPSAGPSGLAMIGRPRWVWLSGTWPLARAACRGEHRSARCRGGEPAGRNQMLAPPATIAMISGEILVSAPQFPICKMGLFLGPGELTSPKCVEKCLLLLSHPS